CLALWLGEKEKSLGSLGAVNSSRGSPDPIDQSPKKDYKEAREARSQEPHRFQGGKPVPRLKRTLVLITLPAAFLWLGSLTAVAGGNPGRVLAPPPAPFTAPLCGAALGDVTVAVDP